MLIKIILAYFGICWTAGVILWIWNIITGKGVFAHKP